MAAETSASNLDAASPERWQEWALAVFGGNQARAAAAARAARTAKIAGASADSVFAAARAAYDAEQPEAEGPANRAGAATNVVLRPSGRRAFTIATLTTASSGVFGLVIRYGNNSFWFWMPATVLVVASWYLALRSRVRIAGDRAIVQGLLRKREFSRLAVRQITVQPWNPSWYLSDPADNGKWTARFVANDFSTLFELRQGAWTRADIDAIGSAIGVRVVDDDTPNSD